MLFKILFAKIIHASALLDKVDNAPPGNACTPLDRMLWLLRQKFSGSDGKCYMINPAGNLNPLSGYFNLKSSLMPGKRILSYAIRKEPRAGCSQSCSSSSAVNNTLNDATDDSPFPFRTTTNELSPEYISDYHRCLLNLFMNINGKATVINDDKSSFYHFLSTNHKDTGECKETGNKSNRELAKDKSMLALLFLLAEDLDFHKLVKTSRGDNSPEAKNIQEEWRRLHSNKAADISTPTYCIAFSTKPNGFEIKIPIVEPSPGTQSGDNCISTVDKTLKFFVHCSSSPQYKSQIATKIQKCREKDNNASFLLDTPQFLLQSYIYEYFFSKAPNENLEFLKTVFTFLDKARMLTDNKTPDASKGDSPGIGAKSIGGSRCFIRSSEFQDYDLGIYEEYSSLMKELQSVRSKSFPFSSFAEPIEPINTKVYDREEKKFLASSFNNSTEATILSILCFLFYNRQRGCFDLSRISAANSDEMLLSDDVGEGNPCKDLLNFFEEFDRPEKLYGNIELMLNKFNTILQDSIDPNISYLYEEQSGYGNCHARNSLKSELLNVLYVIATITNKTRCIEEIIEIRTFNGAVSAKKDKIKKVLMSILTDLSIDGCSEDLNLILIDKVDYAVADGCIEDACAGSSYRWPSELNFFAKFELKYSCNGEYLDVSILDNGCFVVRTNEDSTDENRTNGDSTNGGDNATSSSDRIAVNEEVKVCDKIKSFVARVKKERKTPLIDLLLKTIEQQTGLDVYRQELPKTVLRTFINSSLLSRTTYDPEIDRFVESSLGDCNPKVPSPIHAAQMPTSHTDYSCHADSGVYAAKCKNLKEALRALLKRADKEDNPDLLIEFYNTIKRSRLHFSSNCLMFLDLLRPYLPKKGAEFTNFAINAVFLITQNLYYEEEKSFFFIMLYGIDNAAIPKQFSFSYSQFAPSSDFQFTPSSDFQFASPREHSKPFCGEYAFYDRYLGYLHGKNGKKYIGSYNFNSRIFMTLENLSMDLLTTYYKERLGTEITELVKERSFSNLPPARSCSLPCNSIENTGIPPTDNPSGRTISCSPFFGHLLSFIMQHDIQKGIEILREYYPKDPSILAGLYGVFLEQKNIAFSEVLYISEIFMNVLEKDKRPIDPRYCAFMGPIQRVIYNYRLNSVISEAEKRGIDVRKLLKMNEHLESRLSSHLVSSGNAQFIMTI